MLTWIAALAGLSIAALAAGAALRRTQVANAARLRRLTAFSTDDAPAELLRIHRMLHRPEEAWRPLLRRDGISVDTGWSQEDLADRPVRTYRTTSTLHRDRISLDRMIALLDGGFLTEEVWFKEDFQGGAELERLHIEGLESAKVLQYVSDLKFPPFRHRDFVYLLMRRDLRPDEILPVGEGAIVRQAILGYRSVARPPLGPHLVRALQYPSLDRITEMEDGAIVWEHIMAFHLGGRWPLWLTNSMARAAAKVLWNEAANMRKHCTNEHNPVTAR